MEELIRHLKDFLGNRVEAVNVKGPAEIDVIVNEKEDVESLSASLKSHIIDIVDENTLAKINLVSASGKVEDSFSLNQ